MRSERHIVSAALGLTAALLALASCRGIYLPEPEPEPEPAGAGHSLVVDVIPPGGVEIDGLEIRHNNQHWFGVVDSVRRGSQRIDDGGRVIFEGLLEGPTLLEYSLSTSNGLSHYGTWGVVHIPSPPVEVDLRRADTLVRGAWTIAGEIQELQRLILRLSRRFEGVQLHDDYYAPYDSVAIPLIAGAWAPTLRWEFPSTSPLRSAATDFADSLIAPGAHDLGPSFSRIWLEPRLGGAPLSGARLRSDVYIPSWLCYENLRVSYRDQYVDGRPVPLVHGSRIFRLSVYLTDPGPPFPSRQLWLEADEGDTLRVELAANRVRLRLQQTSQPVSFLRILVDSQRQDTGDLSVVTDEQGEALLWLPDGLYRMRLAAPYLALLGDDLVDVSSDTLLIREVEAP